MSQAHDKFGNVHELLDEYVELEKELADPAIHSDQGKARRLGKRYAELGPVIAGYRAWKNAREDLSAGREMAAEDPDFATEIPALELALAESETKLEELLLPRDPNDDRDVIMEIKAGVGGDESALFAGDLLSRGSLNIDNTTYQWAPTNKLMTSWAWYNNEGKEILRVRPQLHFFDPRAEIRAEHPLSGDTEKLLALLGWHLTLLGHQDPGSHLLASFEIYFGARARMGI